MIQFFCTLTIDTRSKYTIDDARRRIDNTHTKGYIMNTRTINHDMSNTIEIDLTKCDKTHVDLIVNTLRKTRDIIESCASTRDTNDVFRTLRTIDDNDASLIAMYEIANMLSTIASRIVSQTHARNDHDERSIVIEFE